jgi:hypothetical protein
MSRPAEWLGLAAAPTFAAMAAVSAAQRDPAHILCSDAGASMLGGMTAMYLLMSAFHGAPWLNRIDRLWRQSRTR